MEITTLLDTELAVLGLLDENGPMSGYRVMTLAAERGMKEWAGLSPSTVYNKLRRLCSSGLVSSAQDLERSGKKGPVGSLYSASAEGRAALRHQVGEWLLKAGEQSPAFKLALAFSACLPAQHIKTLLIRREALLLARHAEVEKVRGPLQESGKEPRSATLLFDYVLRGLEHEASQARSLARTVGAGEAS